MISQLYKPSHIAGLLLLLTGSTMFGCGESESQPADQAMPPQAVTVLELQPRDLPARFEYIGRLEASREIEIRPRITGLIEQRLFGEGGQVNAGDVLFRIDRAPFEARKEAAQAALSEAQARLTQTQREVARVTPLNKAKAISKREYDDALSNRDLARANVAAARAELTQAQLDLDYTKVDAPIAGRIGRALEVEGALVSPTSGALTRIAQTDPMYVQFSISEKDRLAIEQQQADGNLTMPAPDNTPITVQLSNGSSYARSGQLDFTDYRTDPQTGAFALRATLPNAENKLSPGQFVRVHVGGGVVPSALAVPQRAVQEDANGKFVYLATAGEGGGFVATPKPVEVGQWVEIEKDGKTERLWVIRSGVAAGDRVVIDGTARIHFPGMPIQPQTEAEVAAAAEQAKTAQNGTH